jgi:hypothetical protein
MAANMRAVPAMIEWPATSVTAVVMDSPGSTLICAPRAQAHMTEWKAAGAAADHGAEAGRQVAKGAR